VGWFHSAGIEMVMTVIMVIAALNFSRHFLAFRSLSLKPYKSDSEGKAVLILIGSSIGLVTMALWLSGTYTGFAQALRHAMFNVVSIATTAGFVTENYETWPAFIPVWLLFMSCITCSTGSTGGGIKMFRTLLLVRHARRELNLLVHPSAVIPIRIGGVAIPDRVAYSVLAFIFLYFGTILVLTFAMLATGLDLVSSFSAIVGSVNSVGPGLGEVGPTVNFEPLTDLQTWICTAAMLIGRLEIFSVLVLFTATFWRR
jgi:trk system potassium uptake protein TrkH